MSASVTQGKLQNFVRVLGDARLDLDVEPVMATLQLYGPVQLDRGRYLKNIDHRFAELAGSVTRQNEIKERIKALLSSARHCELQEDASGAHPNRMGALGRLIAEQAVFFDPGLDQLEVAIRLHDLGKVVLPPAAVESPQRYIREEAVRLFGDHAEEGAMRIAQEGDIGLTLAAMVCQSHHERWDGSGYPEGLAGTDIPFPARLTAIVDAFDTMVHGRPYRAPVPVADAVALIMSEAGSAFDPDLAMIFKDIVVGLGDQAAELIGTEESVLIASIANQWSRLNWNRAVA